MRSSRRLIILLAVVFAGLGAVVLFVIFTHGSKQRTDHLELRLCVQHGLAAWDEKTIETAKASFGQKLLLDTDRRIVWREWAGPESPANEVVQIKRGKKIFLALANDKDKCLTHDERFSQWQVAHCEINRNRFGRPALSITLSTEGGNIMRVLSNRYKTGDTVFSHKTPSHLLSIVVDGKIYAEARIVDTLWGSFQISGQGLNKNDLEHIQKAMFRK